jgi:uroporphyrinogen III methyltransferase/synthase
MPERYEGTELASVLRRQDLARRRVLVPRAETARPELVQSLRSQAAEVEELPLYRTEIPQHPNEDVLAQIRHGRIDVATFASSSAVRNLAKMLGDDLTPLRSAAVACIGPITAHTAERCGLRVSVVSAEATIPSLVASLRAYFGSSPESTSSHPPRMAEGHAEGRSGENRHD